MSNLKRYHHLFESQLGFTLIELMVAISIVAILSIVGIVVYTNVQKTARDSRRSQDLNSIANALESKKQAGGVVYQALTAAEFSGGVVPKDPKADSTGSDNQKYCFWGNTDVPPTPGPTAPAYTAGINWSNCTGGGVASDAPGEVIGANIPSRADITSWLICAKLESKQAIECKNNRL